MRREEKRTHRPFTLESMWESMWRKPNMWDHESEGLGLPGIPTEMSTLYKGCSPSPFGHHKAGFATKICHKAIERTKRDQSKF